MQYPAMIWRFATRDQFLAFERRDDLVHGLRSNVESASQISRGPAAAAAGQAQDQILKRRQFEQLQRLDHFILKLQLEKPNQQKRSCGLSHHRKLIDRD
jgi:hypothetical protein